MKALKIILFLIFVTESVHAQVIDSFSIGILHIRDTITLATKLEKTNPQQAFTYFQNALYASEKMNFSNGVDTSLRGLSNLYIKTRNGELYLQIFQQAAIVCSRSGQFRTALPIIYGALAAIYSTKGEYEQATSYYYNAINIGESLPLCIDLPSNYNNISTLFLTLQDSKKINLTKKILYYLDKGEKSAIQYRNYYILGNILVNKGNLYLIDSNIKQSLVYYNQALILAEKEKLPNVADAALNNLANAYLMANEPQEALACIIKDIGLNVQKDPVVQNGEISTLASIYYKLKNYKKAEYYFLQSLKTAQQLNISRDIIFSYQYLSDIYSETGNYKRAYEYGKKLITLKDSVEIKNSMRMISQLELKYRTAEKDAKLIQSQLMITKNQLTITKQENQIKGKNIWILGISAGAFILIIFFISLYKNNQNNRKINRVITEQNTQLKNALVALEQSQEENTKMMKIVAHDLRSPVGAMYSLATLMLEAQERSDEDKEMLDLIKTAGESSIELISQLLQVNTRMEELVKEPVDLLKLLHYCVDLLRFKADEKGQRIDLQAIPLIVSANREKLWRVVSNLIANAIKFSPNNSTISVQLIEKPENVVISVKDHGIGIPEKMRDKIFDMFTEAKRSGTSGEQSFGLGLAISKQIVEAHGGRIWFESKTGDGTTFYVELPV
ncbi:MAG: tetratricopeptide repeat-containing sensor histidine kinase [Flavipsychrobacter sp.]|nr:tetratricopeptide repeat-containing sensor histidine kinase [Flavipsychrobacter sp.]